MVEEWMVIWQEGGMVAVVGIMFVYLVFSLSKKSEAQQNSLESLRVENEKQSRLIAEILKEVDEQKTIIVKLIDRFGRSDETSMNYRNDMMKELSDLSEKVSYMSGRINGK